MPTEGSIRGQYLIAVTGSNKLTTQVPLKGEIWFEPTVTNVAEPAANPNPISWGLLTYRAPLDNAGYICTPGTMVRGLSVFPTDDPSLSVEFQYKVIYNLYTKNDIPLDIESHYISVSAGETVYVSDEQPADFSPPKVYVPASEEQLANAVVRMLGRNDIIVAASKVALDARDAAAESAYLSEVNARDSLIARNQARQAMLNSRGRIEILNYDPQGILPTRPVFRDAPIATPIGSGAFAWNTISGKPDTFPPTIGPGATQAVAGNDERLNDKREPTSHTHPATQVIYSVTDEGEIITLKTVVDEKANQADLQSLSDSVEELKANEGGQGGADLSGYAKLDAQNIFAQTPLIPTITGESPNSQSAVNVDYLNSRLGSVGGTPTDSSSTAKGIIRLSGAADGAADGELTGTADKPKVKGWDSVVKSADLFDSSNDIKGEYLPSTIERTGNKNQADGYAGLDSQSKLDKAQLPASVVQTGSDGKIDSALLPSGGGSPSFNPGSFGFVAPEQFTNVTGVSAKIQAAIDWASTRNLSVHANAFYDLDGQLSFKNKNVRLWGQGTMTVASKDLIENGGITGIHDRTTTTKVTSVRDVVVGPSGSDKPGIANTNVLTEIVPESQAMLAQWQSEDMLRLDSKSVIDSYGFYTAVVPKAQDGSQSGKCWAASTAAVFGIAFSVQTTNGFTEGDYVEQPSTGAKGYLKSYAAGPVRSGSSVTSAGRIIFERLSGTFAAGPVQVGGTTLGSIIVDPVSGALGSIIVKDRFHDSFTTDLVASKLPTWVTEIAGIAFDVRTGPMGTPEDNVQEKYRPSMIVLGNSAQVVIKDVVFRNSWATCILIAGCPDYNIEFRVNNGPNDARFSSTNPSQNIGAYGYGLEKTGPCDRGFADIVGRFIRHVYTTNPYYSTIHPLDVTVNRSDFAIAAAGTSRYGRTKIHATYCWANAWDTHEGCYGEILEDFFIHQTFAAGLKDSGLTGVSSRSWCNTIRNGTIIGAVTAITLAGQSVPGCPTDDINWIENVKGIDWQNYGINLGASMPEKSVKHFTYIRRVDLTDVGDAANRPYNSIGIYGQGVSFALLDVNIDRFSYAPILVRGPKPSGVDVQIWITRTKTNYQNSLNNYNNPIRIENADGMHVWAYGNEVKAKTLVDTSTTTYANDFMPSSFIYATGSPTMHWLPGDVLASTGDNWVVPMFASGGTGSTPIHKHIPVSNIPAATA